MKKYLVTGAAGFIGSNFVKYILRTHGAEADIMVLDALTYAGNLLALKEELKLPNVKFTRGDIADSELVNKLMRDYDPHFVVNFAAESHVDRSITHPELFVRTNILGTQILLEAARRTWLLAEKGANGRSEYQEGRKFLQISTDEVYGSLKRDFDKPQPLQVSAEVSRVIEGRDRIQTFGRNFFTETTPPAPSSPYSAAKTSADLLVLAYYHTYGFPAVITRCSNNYGPLQFPEKLIPLIIGNILEGRKLPIYGKGENVRDWLYVDDHASAIDTVLERGRVGEVYNIGGFNEEQNISIVRRVLSIMSRIMHEEPQYRHLLRHPADEIGEGMISYVADRPGHDMRYAIDPTKIATELGWYPRTTFAEGIEKTVRWYLDNREWVDSVTSGEYRNYYEKMYGNRQ